MKADDTPDFLTPRQVSQRLQINYHKVLDLMHLGELEAYKIGGVFRISEEQLHKFLESSHYKSYWKGKL